MRSNSVVNRIWKYFSCPVPTLFDICLCLGIIGIGYLTPFIQGFYLVFFTMFLMVVSMGIRCKRNIKLPELTLLCLVGLINLFVYSFIWSPKSITYSYLNFYMLSEGFMYLFFGCMLLYFVISKARNIRLLWLTIPLALLPMINRGIYMGQMTFMMSFFVAVTIWLLLSRKYVLFWTTIVFIELIYIFNFQWIEMKFACRPAVWMEMVYQIKQFPFLGSGWNKFLSLDSMQYVRELDARLFMHNDYLAVMKFVGIPVMIPISIFILRTCCLVRKSWLIIPITTILIACFFQSTFLFPDKALILLVIIAWVYVESDKKGEMIWM